mmetsp:Transcript_48895/g.97547  ORF Transcript_48895/g.97547 Transcript_48895/m.97547 type:complete len:169 (-) Transcript_48895:745-1251(-)
MSVVALYSRDPSTACHQPSRVVAVSGAAPLLAAGRYVASIHNNSASDSPSVIIGTDDGRGGCPRARHLKWHCLCKPQPMEGSLARLVEKEWFAAAEVAVLFVVSVEIERGVIGRPPIIHEEGDALMDEGKDSNTEAAAARMPRALPGFHLAVDALISLSLPTAGVAGT